VGIFEILYHLSSTLIIFREYQLAKEQSVVIKQLLLKTNP